MKCRDNKDKNNGPMLLERRRCLRALDKEESKKKKKD